MGKILASPPPKEGIFSRKEERGARKPSQRLMDSGNFSSTDSLKADDICSCMGSSRGFMLDPFGVVNKALVREKWGKDCWRG